MGILSSYPLSPLPPTHAQLWKSDETVTYTIFTVFRDKGSLVEHHVETKVRKALLYFTEAHVFLFFLRINYIAFLSSPCN